DEGAGGRREPAGRDRLVVDTRRGPARRTHLADRDERLRDAVEERLDARGIRAVADEGRVGTRASREPQRVDQEALAGARLAREHVEALGERQPELVDQREVGDRQLEEPARRPGIALGRHRHEGSSWTLVRRRSQNGWAPWGSTKRIGRASARTSTTSPTWIRRSSRPSIDTRAS